MRAAVLTSADPTMEVVELEDPVPGPGEALLEVTACGICGSDLHIAAALAPSGSILGHETRSSPTSGSPRSSTSASASTTAARTSPRPSTPSPRGALDPTAMVTDTIGLDELPTRFAALAHEPDGGTVILRP